MSFSNGVATFTGLTISTADANYTLQAYSEGLTSPQTPIALGVTAAPATQLVVTTQPPATVIAGGSFGLTVSAEDPFGNVDLTFGGDVAVATATNLGGDSLGGTLTVAVNQGVATFSGLTIDRAGTGLTLQVSATGLTSVLTSPFSVTGAPATQLVVTAQPPSSVIAGKGFGLTVSAKDRYGNVDPTFVDSVAIALASSPAGGRLGAQPPSRR